MVNKNISSLVQLVQIQCCDGMLQVTLILPRTLEVLHKDLQVPDCLQIFWICEFAWISEQF